ncbi:MAG: segregation/condensation protein A [Candidatus Nanohaloarchaea archaeon]
MEEHDTRMLAEQPWEETLDILTADMDPTEIDIEVLAGRYREYINELQELDLSVSARAVRICAALLNIKAMAIDGEDPLQEEPEENPMDFDGEMEEIEEDPGPDLEEGPELEMPVKPKPRRRMEFDELKDALEDAIEVKERREERQEERQELDQQFEMQEETLNDRINSLFSRVKDLVSTEEKVEFSRLLEEKSNEEKIEKFMHVLHLENDKKVRCIQEEFLGDLHVKPEEEVAN